MPISTPAYPTAILAALISLQFSAQAQHGKPNDFLVLANGDTLRGQIRQGVLSNFLRNGVRFRAKGEATKHYSPTEIRSFGTGNQVSYVTRALPTGQMRFVVPIASGPVAAYVGERQDREKRYFLELPDSARLLELDPKTYRLQLIRSLPTCAGLDFGSATLNRDYPYKYQGIVKLVRAYNSCRYPEANNAVVKTAQGWRFRPGLKVGFASLNYSYYPGAYGHYGQDAQVRTVAPFAGLFMRVTNRSPFGAQLELNYTSFKHRFVGTNVFTNGASYRLDRTTYKESSQLQVALLGNLFLFRGKVSPFICGGVAYEHVVAQKSYQENYRYDLGLREVVDIIDQSPRNSGLVFGGGATLALRKHSLLSVEYRIHKISEGAGVPAPTRTIGRLDLGFSF